jgi:hypothetical protein
MRSLDLKDRVFQKIMRFLKLYANNIRNIDFEDNLITDDGLNDIAINLFKEDTRFNIANNNISMQGALKLITQT